MPALADRAQLVWEAERLALLGGDYDLSVSVAGAPARLAGFSVAREPGDPEGLVDLRGSFRTEPLGVGS